MRSFRRGWPLILVGALLFGAIAQVEAQRMPTLYRAEATLLFRFGREYFPITPTEVQRNWGENVTVTLDTALATEMHLLSSFAVAYAAVTGTSEADPAVYDAGSEDSLASVQAFQENLTVRRVQGATMVNLEIVDPDPVEANRLLDRILDAYQHHREALFDGEAQAYFAARRRGLAREARSVLDDLAQLQAEINRLEGGSAVTQPSREDLVGAADAPAVSTSAALETEVSWLEEAINLQQVRLEALREERAALEKEWTDWEASQAYRAQVAPTIQVADRSPVQPLDTLTTVIIRVAAASALGAVLVWGAFALGMMMLRPRSRRSSSARPWS